VFVDLDMWEKIVLNLLSNAFKFTFEGQITVSLRPAGEFVDLRVSDTGSESPPPTWGACSKRFYRVKNARARTH
jgi:signal transduction histidine kinase